MRYFAIGSAILSLLPVQVVAQGTCPNYQINLSGGQRGGPAGTPGAACSQLAQAISYDSGSERVTYNLSAVNVNEETGQFQCSGTVRNQSFAGSCEPSNPEKPAWCDTTEPAGFSQFGFMFQGECDDPEEQCDPASPLVQATAGKKFTSKNLDQLSAYSSDFCNPVTSCKTKVTSAVAANGETVWTMEHTAEACAANATPVPEEDVDKPEECLEVGDGQYCASNTGNGQCGYFNDTYICLKKITGGCRNVEGGRICDVSVKSTPPVPDSGVKGVPATPDGVLTTKTGADGAGGTYNYYNSTTVNNSSRPAGDGKTDTGGTEDTKGDTPLVPGQLPDVDVEEYDTVTGQFLARVENAPIIQAASGIAQAFPQGVCPKGNLSLFGDTIPFEAHCDLYEGIAPLLSGLFIAMWGLLGIRTILSA